MNNSNILMTTLLSSFVL